MSTLLMGQNFAGEAPSDEMDVRSTITVVDNDAPAATAERTPDFNSSERDPDTEGGLTPRAVSDYRVGSERWIPDVGNANTDFASPINSQVSTSGTAAQRESEGHWGHGTKPYQDAIEPVIREGGYFDNVYFDAKRPTIQEGAMDYMIPSRRPDDKTAQDISIAANADARQAGRASAYQLFLNDRTGL